MRKRRTVKTIKCNVCEKMIGGFLNDNLSIYDTDILLNHVENCASCMDELTIQYLVTEGFLNVEKSGDYNLVDALDRKINMSKRKVENHFVKIDTLILFFSLLLVLSILAIIIILFL